jgi:hypothetical protein
VKVYRWEDSDGVGPLCGLSVRKLSERVFYRHTAPCRAGDEIEKFVDRNCDFDGNKSSYKYVFGAMSFDWLVGLTMNFQALADAGISLKEFEVSEDYMVFDGEQQIMFNRDLAVITNIIEAGYEDSSG